VYIFKTVTDLKLSNGGEVRAVRSCCAAPGMGQYSRGLHAADRRCRPRCLCLFYFGVEFHVFLFTQIKVSSGAQVALRLEEVKTAIAEVERSGRLVTRGPGQVSCRGATGEVSSFHALSVHCFSQHKLFRA
jgi:hypothetical protein